MQTNTVKKNNITMDIQRESKYSSLYKELDKLGPDEAKTIECDTDKETKNLYSALKHRDHYNVSMRKGTIIVTLDFQEDGE